MRLILIILTAIGVTLIYDARRITQNYFGKQDQNKTVTILKLVGFVVSVASGIALVMMK